MTADPQQFNGFAREIALSRSASVLSKKSAHQSAANAPMGLSNQPSLEVDVPLIPDSAGAPAIQSIPVIYCDAPTADEWFVVLKHLVRLAKVYPRLGQSDAWRGTYAYAHSRYLSAFEVVS